MSLSCLRQRDAAGEACFPPSVTGANRSPGRRRSRPAIRHRIRRKVRRLQTRLASDRLPAVSRACPGKDEAASRSRKPHHSPATLPGQAVRLLCPQASPDDKQPRARESANVSMYVSPELRPTLSRRLSRALGGSLSATRKRNCSGKGSFPGGGGWNGREDETPQTILWFQPAIAGLEIAKPRDLQVIGTIVAPAPTAVGFHRSRRRCRPSCNCPRSEASRT